MTSGLILILLCPFLIFYGSDPLNGDDCEGKGKINDQLIAHLRGPGPHYR